MRGAATLLDLHYQREDEEEADRGAVELLARSGISPRALVDLFRMFQKVSVEVPNAVSYLSSHPQTEARIDYVKSLVEAPATDTAGFLPEVNWQELRGACGVAPAGAKADK